MNATDQSTVSHVLGTLKLCTVVLDSSDIVHPIPDEDTLDWQLQFLSGSVHLYEILPSRTASVRRSANLLRDFYPGECKNALRAAVRRKIKNSIHSNFNARLRL